jgi:peptidyl-prolyl isomerase E (cyclophilin E)
MTARKTLYIGGIPHDCPVEVVRAAFIPFGELRDVHIPMDYKDNTNKGYCFVEFIDEDDANAAMDNMDGAEIMGKVIRVNATKGLNRNSKGKALWEEEAHLQATALGESDTVPEMEALAPSS